MRYVLMCAAAGALFITTAKADETVKWRAVQHVASNQTQQVGDANGHLLGLARIPGIVFFPDGSTGTSLVISTYDFVLGSGGIASGYYSINLADGSELWIKYTGTLKVLATGKVAQKGTGLVIGGKGRFAGATGDGTWEGEQTQTANLPGEAIAYIDNVYNIRK